MRDVNNGYVRDQVVEMDLRRSIGVTRLDRMRKDDVRVTSGVVETDNQWIEVVTWDGKVTARASRLRTYYFWE